MKYCIKCGELLKKEDQFCDHCGAKQPHIEESSHSTGLNDLNGLKASIFKSSATMITNS